MYGSSGTMTLPNQSLAGSTANQKQTNGGVFGSAPGGTATTITFLSFVALYVFWALFQQHQKLKAQIQPKNLAINLHNLFATILTVLVGVGLLKLLLAKLVAINFPGSTTLSNIVKFAF